MSAQGHLELARPMVRRGAGFDTDQTWRQLLEERQDIATLQLTADNCTNRRTRMRRRHAPSNGRDTFFAVRSWVDCITIMSEFDLRQAQVGLRL